MAIISLSYLTLYLAGLCTLIWVVNNRRRWYAAAKTCLSLLFVAGGLLAFALGQRQHPLLFALLFVALGLCALGDLLLGLANKTKVVRARPFKAGALCFSLAHLVFCLLFSFWAPPRLLDLALPAVTLALVWLLEKKGRVRFKSMRRLGYIYVALVSFMTGKALMIAASPVPAGFAALTGIGGALFLASDVVLMFLYFGTRRSKAYRFANLILYYISILLLSLTAYWY